MIDFIPSADSDNGSLISICLVKLRHIKPYCQASQIGGAELAVNGNALTINFQKRTAH